jgi:DNA polymerase-3 subunit gamma/tau
MILRRESKTGSNDLHVVYRPYLIDEMIGNDTNKKLIRNALDENKVPHTQLFTGDAGCGKTTAARIVALGLNCEEKGVTSKPCLKCGSCLSIIDGNSIDVKEINVGQSGGKDYVDAIVKELPTAAWNSRFKIIIFDEAHELTNAAKDLLLKPIENGYDHVYYIFCTNQPEKLRSRKKDVGEAFLDRCSVLNFNRVPIEQIQGLLQDVVEFEGMPLNHEILSIVSNESKGVPRNALVWLNQISTEGSWDPAVAREICGSITEEDDPNVFKLAQLLNKGNFKEAVALFEKVSKTAQAETVRIRVAAYFVSALKKARTVDEGRKFSAILDILTIPIYEQGKVGEYKMV